MEATPNVVFADPACGWRGARQRSADFGEIGGGEEGAWVGRGAGHFQIEINDKDHGSPLHLLRVGMRFAGRDVDHRPRPAVEVCSPICWRPRPVR